MVAKSRQTKTSRLHKTVTRYRAARKSLHTPASPQSRYGLDWMNFFVADVQTGFGTFVAFYLAHLGWSHGDIGFGANRRRNRRHGGPNPRRGACRLGEVEVRIGGAWDRHDGRGSANPGVRPVVRYGLHRDVAAGRDRGIITPAIAGISLGLVGRRGMSVRTGRNFRYAAGGHAVTAALMGAAGAYFADSAIFIAAAMLCIPALIALSFIRPDEIDYRKARNAAKGKDARNARVIDLAKNHKLVLFTSAIVLFQLADASMLPLIGENLAATIKSQAPIWMSVLIIVPQSRGRGIFALGRLPF